MESCLGTEQEAGVTGSKRMCQGVRCKTPRRCRGEVTKDFVFVPRGHREPLELGVGEGVCVTWSGPNFRNITLGAEWKMDWSEERLEASRPPRPHQTIATIQV